MSSMVLVVEDEETRRIPVEKHLQDAGYDTRWTDSTSLAWKYLERGACASAVYGPDIVWESVPGDGYKLVVLDVDELRELPRGPVLRGEGIKFLRKLRGDPRFSKKKLPVIGVTHLLPPDSASWKETFMRAGGNCFFECPLDLSELVRSANRLLGENA